MIKIVKLNNNVEIIGNVVSQDHTSVTVENPFTINYMISDGGDKPIVGLMRYMPFAAEFKVVFFTDGLLHVVDARESMVGYYKAILKTHLEDIDISIDTELLSITSEPLDTVEDVSDSVDALAAMLDRIKPNNKLH